MRKIALLLLFATELLFHPAFSSTPLRRSFTAQQSDGSELIVKRASNERYAFYSTTDGWTLLRDAKGDLCYVISDGDGNLTSSSVIAHNESSRSTEETNYIKGHAIKIADAFQTVEKRQVQSRSVRRSMIATQDNGLGKKGVSAQGEMPSIGSPTIPVIMVDFPDLPFSLADETALDEQMNAENYTDNLGSVGSLKQYFTDQSYGSFAPNFQIIGHMRASYNHDYYGGNANGAIDVRIQTLLNEVLSYLDAQGFDASKFQVNGSVPVLTIYYAGEGEQSAYGNDADGFIWAHKGSVSNKKLGGYPLKSYLATNELIYEYPTSTDKGNDHLAGIGVFAHELCHALGLPDVYNTLNNTGDDDALAMDYWSLMDAGEHWQNGYAPVGLTAYERSFLGWLDITTITQPGYYELESLAAETGDRAYRIVNKESDDKEYYILENRQADKWFPQAMGYGMLVTHIDYNATAWNNNKVNTDPTRLRYTYIPADNKRGPYTETNAIDFTAIKGDLFPGSTNNRQLTDTSSPSALVNIGEKMGQPVYNINMENGIVGFSFLDNTLTQITQIANEGSQISVYDLNGRLRMQTTDIRTINGKLQPGLYIVKTSKNVQKIIIQ